jgi:hypothetical protein
MKNSKLPLHNKSGVIGVHWNKNHKYWCAQIMVDRKTIHLGSFKDINDAIKARKNAEKLYGFHENHGRAYCTTTGRLI